MKCTAMDDRDFVAVRKLAPRFAGGAAAAGARRRSSTARRIHDATDETLEAEGRGLLEELRAEFDAAVAAYREYLAGDASAGPAARKVGE